MSASHIREFHRRNSPRRIYFFTYDNLGALVSTLTTPDTEISQDGGAFTDCTNEATAVSDGLHYIDLTATETNADKIAIIVKAANANYTPTSIISDAVLEISQMNIMGAVTGANLTIHNSLSTAGVGRAIEIESTGSNAIRFRTGNTSQHCVLFDGRFLGNNALMISSYLGAAISAQSNGGGIQLFGNTNGFDIRNNSQNGIWIDNNTVNDLYIRSTARDSAIRIVGPTGSTMPLINVVHPATGNIPAIRIESSATGGGSALELKSNNYVSFALELSQTNATGQCIKFGGYLPEPTMPFDKDTATIGDAIAYIFACMANRTVLNKDTLTHTLYKRDNSSTLVARTVSDDGTSQSISATD